jgi:hypothetical protein
MPYVELIKSDSSKVFVNSDSVIAVEEIPPAGGLGLSTRADKKPSQSKIILSTGHEIVIMGNADDAMSKLRGPNLT